MKNVFLGCILLAALGCGKGDEATPEVRAEADIRSGKMALIPAGEFRMGSPDGEGASDEHPRHKVYLDAFYIDKYEVKAEEYRECIKAGKCPRPRNAIGFGGDKAICNLALFGLFDKKGYPANCVQWSEAKAYCEWAGKRLPTEAEWEKAARGGTDTTWHFGNNKNDLDNFAWPYGEPWRHPVGAKIPNQYGLYDMYGTSEQEWVADAYDKDFYKNSPAKDPKGPERPIDELYVLRGWSSAARGSCMDGNPDNNYYYCFRCAK